MAFSFLYTLPKGRYLYDVHKFVGFSDPLPLSTFGSDVYKVLNPCNLPYFIRMATNPPSRYGRGRHISIAPKFFELTLKRIPVPLGNNATNETIIFEDGILEEMEYE